MGPHEASIARQAYISRQPMPERIKNAPELFDDLGLYLNAFLWLDTERSDGPIPWSSIIRYARYHKLDAYQTENLLEYIRELDRIISAHRAEKIKSAGKTGSKSTGKSPAKLKGK